MAKEIERKFLVRDWESLKPKLGTPWLIRQGYLVGYYLDMTNSHQHTWKGFGMRNMNLRPCKTHRDVIPS